jgi:1,4-alpha-glucan branching enzyme
LSTGNANIDTTTPLGANVAAGGASFRVWAPAAEQVFVLTGAALEAAAQPGFAPAPSEAMLPLGDGTWGAFVAGAGEGTRYRYWIVGAGSAGLKRDPRARELCAVPAFPHCDCLVRDPGTYPWHDQDFRPAEFSDQIQYQLHIGSYFAVDQHGNDKRGQVGKFLDLLDRVEYLQDLGINAVLFLPVQEFPTHTSIGYNGVDLFSPETEYQVPESEIGRYLAKADALLTAREKSPLSIDQLRPGPNQLKCVIDIFHVFGIAVLFDLVFNHGGPGFDDQSLWFFDRQPQGDDNRSLYFTDHDWIGGRVFAYWNANVRQFLIDNAELWLEEYHIDGIRYDEITVTDNNGGGRFCQDLSSTVRFLKPQAIQIAEYWRDDRAAAVRPVPIGLGFDAAWSDKLREAIRGAVAQASGGRDASVDIEALARGFEMPAGFDSAWRVVNFIEDHDTVFAGRKSRIPALADPADHRSWNARSRTRVAAGLLMAARGIPMLFMGQEILEDKQWNDDVVDRANLLIWWDGLKTDQAMRDYLQFCRDLIRLRRAQPALRGDQLRVSTRNGLDRVIAIHRWIEGAGRDVLLVANLQEMDRSGYRIGFPGAGGWQEIFNSDFYDGLPNPSTFGNAGGITADEVPWDGMPASAAVNLPANGFIAFAR